MCIESVAGEFAPLTWRSVSSVLTAAVTARNDRYVPFTALNGRRRPLSAVNGRSENAFWYDDDNVLDLAARGWITTHKPTYIHTVKEN